MSRARSVFLSAISGNLLEYYDFTVYSVFAIIIGKTFFPNTSPFIQDLSSLAVFAVGFLTRPIGGIFFGYIGDKYGRRISLIISMLGMTIPTFTIGLIPSYDDIGIYAPVTLIFMRLIQGLCISGEGAGAAIFVLEHYQNLRPGLTTGIVHGSNIAGTLIATLVGIIVDHYFPAVDFAWRYAFLLGGFVGIIGFYLRLRVSETPIFRILQEKKQTLRAPFSHVLRTAWPSILVTICVGAVASSVVYLVKTYINVFYRNVMHFDNITSLKYLFYSSFILMLAMPLFGWVADIISKLKMIVFASVAIITLSIPTLILMGSDIFIYRIIALTMLGLLGGAISGAAYIFIISLFTPEQRFSGVAFSYNLGIAIFGGTSPMISRWLVEQTNLFYTPAFYIMTTAAIFLVMLYAMYPRIKSLIN